MEANIRCRLMRVGKKQVDLIPELRKRGIPASPQDISGALSGHTVGAKAANIRYISTQLVNQWEKEFDEQNGIT